MRRTSDPDRVLVLHRCFEDPLHLFGIFRSEITLLLVSDVTQDAVVLVEIVEQAACRRINGTHQDRDQRASGHLNHDRSSFGLESILDRSCFCGFTQPAKSRGPGLVVREFEDGAEIASPAVDFLAASGGPWLRRELRQVARPAGTTGVFFGSS